jgi:hypothetical protein
LRRKLRRENGGELTAWRSLLAYFAFIVVLLFLTRI